MKKIVDLSIPIRNGMPYYPGDPKPKITPKITVEQDGCQVMELQIGTHTGTHIDAPCHFLPGGSTVDQIPLEKCTGTALVIPLKGLEPYHAITPEDIEPYRPLLAKYQIVLFHTGWTAKFGTEEFFRHPYLTTELAELFAASPIKAIGVDMLNVDRTNQDGSLYNADACKVHDILLKKEIIIIENLTNLDQVDFEEPFCIFYPLKIEGADGSPVRAAAIEQ